MGKQLTNRKRNHYQRNRGTGIGNNQIVEEEDDAIPSEIRDSIRFVQKRFQFNIEQIEKRYSCNSSGLVEFDANECTANDDSSLLNNIKKELHKHTLCSYGGSALLSTPAQDPDEKEETNLTHWMKLNKLYDHFLSASAKENLQLMTRRPAVIEFRQPLQPLKDSNIPTFFYHQTNIADFERNNDNYKQYADAVFPRFIKTKSIAESHAIADSVVIPLLPKFRTPCRYNRITNYQSPMTRLKKKMLAIEENYDKRTDIIYAKETDWVMRWVNDTSRHVEQLQEE